MDDLVLTPNPYTENRNGYSSRSQQPNQGSNILNHRHSKAVKEIPEYNHYKENIQPQTGCLQLGHDGDKETYTTRFRIDAAAERRHASKGVFLEECCLCSAEENRETPFRCMAAIIMSEGFLLTFHLVALTLGVAKSCINRENINKDVEFIHSICEVLAVSFVLFARVMLTRRCRNAIEMYRKEHQHIEIDNGESIVGKHLNLIVTSFTVICIIFECMCIGAFFIFYYFVHLGWTTLVNNAVLIIGTTLGNIIIVKLEKVRTTIIEDEHKVVLYESSFLLKEGTFTLTKEQKADYHAVVDRYLNALMDTELFQPPPHVKVVDQYGLQWNAAFDQIKMSSWI